MISYKKQKGFSLIEVMMTLLVVSLVMVLMAPFVTKKIKTGTQDGVVYTYNDQLKNTDDANNYCFATNVNASGNIVYEATTNCSEYEFTVPKGITSVNLTLVAGGGGGGGASGMLYWKSTKNQRGLSGNDFYNNSKADIFTEDNNIDIKNIKKLTINYFMPAGQPTKLPGCGASASDSDGNSTSSDGKYCNGKNWSQYLKDTVTGSPNEYGKYVGTTGKGGASSPALIDYEVPKSIYKYSSLTDILDDADKKEYLSMNIRSSAPKYGVSADGDNANEYDIDGNTDYKYKYDKATDRVIYDVYDYKDERGRGGKATVYADMRLGDKLYTYRALRLGDTFGKVSIVKNDTNYPLPEIPEKNIIPIKKGKEGVQFYFKINNNSSNYPIQIALPGNESEGEDGDYNVTYFGGEGASINIGAYGNCGIGGHGYSFAHTYDSAGPHNYYSQTINFGTSCLESTVTYIPSTITQKPGGNGGAGGTAVRIVDFKVTPEATYIIRVGKGGTGGANGTDKIANVGTYPAPVSGQNGTGGVSTSIWERTYDNNGRAVDTLVYLVTGGVGGFGGEYKGLSQKKYTQKTFHRLVGNSKNALQNTMLDRNIAEKINDVGSMSLPMNTGNVTKRALAIVESYLNRRPYTFLNYIGTTFIDRCMDNNVGNTRGTNSCSGGYNAYNTQNNTSFNSHLIENVQPNGNATVTAYDGLYHKTYDNNGGAAYVGGNGGFSGLGTKAGCGGMFMGNSRGIISGATGITDSDNQSTNVQNKFISPQETVNFRENRNIYSAFEYYDNCTLNTPNGQSAKFIAPDPKILNYGQAGSGGGGGGYTMDKGAGKGGDGQDGYVMIDWRK